MSQVTVGRIVHYKLGEGDVGAIQSRRSDGGFSGNQVRAGDVYPAIVVRIFPGGTEANGVCNLRVILDGDDTYWATSRVEGAEPGMWAWPPRL